MEFLNFHFPLFTCRQAVPITTSAKKALRQSKKKRVANLKYTNRIKSLVKEIKKLVAEKKTKEAKELLTKYYKALDKAAKENVIKKNAASRKKSRITLLVNKIAQ